MKILSAQQIRALDAHTIQHEPIDSSDLMERASQTFARAFQKHFAPSQPVYLFCGTGNNGGDGLCVARLLEQEGYSISLFICPIGDYASPDFDLNLTRIDKANKLSYLTLQSISDFPNIPPNAVVIDALFGSGLNRPLQDLFKYLVSYLNAQDCHKVAIDMPSGIQADAQLDSRAFKAEHTFTFELPKLSQLLPQNHSFVGQLHILPIGLDQSFIETLETGHFFLDTQMVYPLIHNRNKYDHKGTFGHALLMAGSYGKTGAALLSAKACLKSGAGLLTAYVPDTAYPIFQTALPECMLLTDEDGKKLSSTPDLSKYKAIALGPGLGQHPATAKMLKFVLEHSPVPLVLDADALNIIAKHQWHHLIPPKSILTPHPKEFERLCGKAQNDYHQLELLQNYAHNIQSVVLIKRAHTVIATPEGQLYFNSTGNPFMGTAGSGDVLTGILLGLRAQGYSDTNAAILGVYFHGKAGDEAHQKKHHLLASDLIDFFRLDNK